MNILLTCAGRRNYIVDYFKEALQGKGGKVFAANSTPDSTALITADEAFVVPGLYEKNYIDALIYICQKHNIKAVISLFDLELPILAKAKERFADLGISVLVSVPQVIEICNDKWNTYQFLVERGFNTPKSYRDLASAQAALQNDEIVYPVLIKPRWGMGSIAVFEAEDEQELVILYRKVKRMIYRTYLATESMREREADVIIQEKLVGQEYGLDVVNDLNANYVTTFVKKKIAMRSGETDAASTVKNHSLEHLGWRLSNELQHIANLDVDVFVYNDRISVLELNPRFGGGYPFSHMAGANIPAAIVAWLYHEQPDPDWLQVDYGITGYKGISMMQLAECDWTKV